MHSHVHGATPVKIVEQYLVALRVLDYTDCEARFLSLAATHSGYFEPRQFNTFADVNWGNRSDRFTRKLETRGHATWREYFGIGSVYHLCVKDLYTRIGKGDLRYYRVHSIEFITTRLVQHDFISANQQYDYLETENQKLSHFSEALGIPKTALPVKTYAGSSSSRPSLRYFADQFPMFLAGSGDSADSPVTFCYVDAGEASVAGFRHHLKAYEQLLSNLADFQFFYLSNSTTNFAAAERYFARFSGVLRDDRSGELIRHFRMRARRDQEQNGSLSQDEIVWLDQASRRFDSRETERLYVGWLTGEMSEGARPRQLAGTLGPRWVAFSQRLVARGQATAKRNGRQW
jgi:hypothetical protein